ncbi:class I SAM-dependent methyltransferase [uncultured Enterococcus sp.]|uniref:class I SAM-dependent methyltransferase n=1 Tax=uncultured Enterococcus sp. TaxID=167972 RepID=UPI002AA72A5A|nr:class I SAM-dependent methyltransferase [uncultured Enterococcus sp.]
MNNKISKYRLPKIYEKGTDNIWTDPYISSRLLEAHLNPEFEGASRKKSFIDASALWIEQQFPVVSFPKVIDYGCGPGLYAERMAEKGYDVTGIDFSKRSIKQGKVSAAKKSLPITYIYGNYLTWQPQEAYDLALLIYCDYGALSREERKALLTNIYASLNSGGQLLMDNFTTKQLEDFKEETSWQIHEESDFWSEGMHVVFNRSKKYPQHTILDQAIVQKVDTMQVYNIWKYFSTKNTLTEELEEAGFTVQAYYQDVAGRKYDVSAETITIVAKKE